MVDVSKIRTDWEDVSEADWQVNNAKAQANKIKAEPLNALGLGVIEALSHTSVTVNGVEPDAQGNIVLPMPSPAEVAAMQAVLDDYQAGQDATATAVASVVPAAQVQAALDQRYSRDKVIDANKHGVKADGTTDDRAAWQAIVDAAPEGSVITWTGNSVLDGAIIWKSGVSLVGQGWGQSVLSTRDTTGSNYFPAIQYLSGDGASIANPLTDCTFSNFEVDGSGLSGTAPHISGKAIFAQWLVRCRFVGLYLHDTVGTALGTDYMPDCLIAHNLVERGGRNWNGAAGGHAGIGIGTGAWEYESLVIANNTVRDCGHWGIFVEYQSGEPYQGTGVRIVGNTVVGGQGFGIGDRGARGTLIANNLVTGTTKAGIVLTYGAQDDIVTGNHVYATSDHGISIEPNAARNDISGNTVVGCAMHGINIRSEDSMTSGIHADGYKPRSPGHRVRGNRVHGNGVVGIYVNTVGGATSGVDDLEITDNTITENGRTHASYKQGVRTEANINHLTLSRNRIYDRQGAPTQSGGINIAAGAYTVGGGVVHGNDMTGQVNPATITPTTLALSDNVGLVDMAKGTATIADGASSVTVPYGTFKAASHVVVTPHKGELIWVSTKGTFNFIVSRTGTTGALTFDWVTRV